MIAKTFEVRDRATFMPVLAIQLGSEAEADRYLLARCGYGLNWIAQSSYVVMWGLKGGQAEYDPYAWPNRTRNVAHRYILEHFAELESGSVVDVEYILGERIAPKVSEAHEGAAL